MNPVNYFLLFIFLVPTTSAYSPLPKPKPLIRNFMVTECSKKNVCLMKMRPHEQYRGKDGQIYWRKIQ